MSTGRPSGFGDPGAAILTTAERVRGVGLPFATLILSAVLSAAAFGIQMVQHSFEIRQANIENGFRFYFENRTALAERTDADKEMSLLKLIGNAFPNVYCDVRQDVYERASAADIGIIPAAGPAPFGPADRANLVAFLIARDRPSSPQFAKGLFAVIGAAFAARGSDGEPEPCAPLAGMELPPVQTAAAPAEKAGESATPPAAPATGTAEEIAVSAQRALAQEAHVYRVFVHIGVTGTKHVRPLDIADQFRDELAAQQFRVMQGVQLVDTKILPDRGEVRYFGPQEREAAEKLALYLTEKFRAEKLEFMAKSIGESFPYMNPDNIEVWIPDPAARKAPAKAAG